MSELPYARYGPGNLKYRQWFLPGPLFLKDNPEISDQIEMLIRANEGLVDIEVNDALQDEELKEGELISE